MKKNILKIIATACNDECGLPDGFYSVSDIQDYIKNIIKKYETLSKIPPIHIYINRINNSFSFQTKYKYQSELQSLKQ